MALTPAQEQAWLDAWRMGIGTAIRAIERVRGQLPCLPGHDTTVVLASIVDGLRILSASAVIEDGEVRRG